MFGFYNRDGKCLLRGTDLIFISKLGLSPVSIMTLMLHNHLHLHVALTGSNGAKPDNFPKSSALLVTAAHWTIKYIHFSI